MAFSGTTKIFKIKNFRNFLLGKFLFTIGVQIQSVVVGWQVYKITNDPFSLGLIGLSEAIPYLSIAFFAGNLADLYNRKKIMLLAVSLYLACAILLYFLSTDLKFLTLNSNILPFYIVIFVTGIARGFLSPSASSLMTNIITKENYQHASIWNSNFWQGAAIIGPAIGGLLLAKFNPAISYIIVIILVTISLLCYSLINYEHLPAIQGNESLTQRIAAGLVFFRNNKIMLSAISLDMFAVLFGGAVAMLPVFAEKILHCGPDGFGLLRSAPAAGSVLMGIIIAYRPIKKNAGKLLLMSVFAFGLATIAFALSTTLWLSIAFLFLTGAFDCVSVIIRHTILQIYTPDEMRGRVNAINFIFIGTSNELGSFESGLAAKLMTLVPSVIFGGGMTLLVTTTIWKLVPELKKLDFQEK